MTEGKNSSANKQEIGELKLGDPPHARDRRIRDGGPDGGAAKSGAKE